MSEPVTAQPGDAAMEVWREACEANSAVTAAFDWDFVTEASQAKCVAEANEAAAAIIRAYGDARVAEDREAIVRWLRTDRDAAYKPYDAIERGKHLGQGGWE